jgi:hypothetical protein
MSFGLGNGQVSSLDVTSPHGWPLPPRPRPPTTRRPHTVPTMRTSGGRRPISIARRPAWDYSETTTNRTQAIDLHRVKTDAGPSLYNRHEVHQSFFYVTRPAIHRISDGLTDRLNALQAKGDAVVFSSRGQKRPKTRQELTEEQQRAAAAAELAEQREQEVVVNRLFWEITEGKLPDDVNQIWRRPQIGTFAWS